MATEYTSEDLLDMAHRLAERDLAEAIEAGDVGGSNRPRALNWFLGVHNRGAQLRVSYVDGAGNIRTAAEAL